MAELPKDAAFGTLGFFLCHTVSSVRILMILKDNGLMKVVIYEFARLTQALTLCGEDGNNSEVSEKRMLT